MQRVIDIDLLRDSILGSLQSLLTGAAADLQAFGAEIALSVARVAAMPPGPDRDLYLDELKGQVATLAEIHRIRANNAAWNTAGEVVAALVRGLAVGLAAV